MQPVQNYIPATTLLQMCGTNGKNDAVRRRASLLAFGTRYTILHEEMRPFDADWINSLFVNPVQHKVFGPDGPGTVPTFAWPDIRKEWNRQFISV